MTETRERQEISHRKLRLRQSSSTFGTLNRQGLTLMKLVYDLDRPDRWLNLTASAFNQLVSIPAVLVARPTATGNSPFSSLSGGRNHRHGAFSRKDGQAELACVAGYITRWFTCPKAVTHPTTNRTQRRATALIETNALPIR